MLTGKSLFLYKLACTFSSSIHALTCGSLFHMVHHSALGALWKWVLQVHSLQIPEVSGNLPFAFSLKMERFGAAQHCWAIHYRTKKCLGLGRQATNGPSFCPENIKIDMWDMQHLWNTMFSFPSRERRTCWMVSFWGWLQWLTLLSTHLRRLLPIC